MGIHRDEDLFLDNLDNCPGVPNDIQADEDSNDVGDACEPVPEPSELALLVAGGLGLVSLYRRRTTSQPVATANRAAISRSWPAGPPRAGMGWPSSSM